MSLLSFLKKKKSHTLGLIQIGSHSVTGAHVLLLGPDADPIVTSYHKTEVPYYTVDEVRTHLSTLLQSLARTCHEIQKNDIHTPEAIHVLLRAPWVSSKTIILSYEQKTQFECTQELVQKLIEKDSEHFQEQEHEYVVEKSIAEIRLNGYTIADPYNRKTNQLGITYTITYASLGIIDFIKKEIEKVYPQKTIRFSALMTVFADTILRYRKTSSFDILLATTNPQMSEIGVIKDGVLHHYDSFFVGTGDLYTTIAAARGISPEDAHVWVQTYLKNMLSDSENEECRTYLKEFQKKWQHSFHQTIAKKEYGLCLPSQCCFLVDTKYTDFFHESIRTDPYLLHNCGSTKFELFSAATIIPLNAVSFPDASGYDFVTVMHILSTTQKFMYTSVI